MAGPPPGCPVSESNLVDVTHLPRVLQWLLAIAVVLISGFFAGMTLGIMGLDKVGLQILATAGDSEKERRHAKVLIPVREKGNWLLCTLLIANTIANTFLPILIASFAGGIYGFIGSTILILVLAEIAPQAICSRYGLVLAARMIYVIYFFMVVLAPVAWPLSWVLDKILGREVGTIYSRAELKHLITIHVENPEHQEESGLTREDYKVISGALDIRDKRVRDVMTRVDKVFMLDASTRLNFDEMLTIYKSGYTRIPVWQGHRQNIIGILYTKDLILVDPDDEVEVRAIIALQGCAGGAGGSGVQYILDVTPLNEVFKLFKTCGTHLMVACKLTKGATTSSPAAGAGIAGLGGSNGDIVGAGAAGADAASNNANANSLSTTARSQRSFLATCAKEVTGIITLEDVLEEVIQDEIVDESDVWASNDQLKRVPRGNEKGNGGGLGGGGGGGGGAGVGGLVVGGVGFGGGPSRRARPDVATYLSLFEHKLRDASRLSAAEVQAAAAFLATSVKEFRAFGPGDAVLKGLVRQAEVIDAGAGSGAAAGEGLVVRGERSAEGDASDAAMAAAAAAGASAVSPSPSPASSSPIRTLMNNAAAAAKAAAGAATGGASAPAGAAASGASSAAPSSTAAANRTAAPGPSPFDVRHGEVQLYARGVRSCHLTLVLQGRVCVRAGSEGFESELGPWSHLGAKALSASPDEPYVPDFDAVALPPCRVLRIHADAYRVALRVGEANAVAAGRAVRQALSETAAQRTVSGLGQARRSQVALASAATSSSSVAADAEASPAAAAAAPTAPAAGGTTTTVTGSRPPSAGGGGGGLVEMSSSAAVAAEPPPRDGERGDK